MTAIIVVALVSLLAVPAAGILDAIRAYEPMPGEYGFNGVYDADLKNKTVKALLAKSARSGL